MKIPFNRYKITKKCCIKLALGPFKNSTCNLKKNKNRKVWGSSGSSDCSAPCLGSNWRLKGRGAAGNARRGAYRRKTCFLSFLKKYPPKGCTELMMMAGWASGDLHKAPIQSSRKKKMIETGCLLTHRSYLHWGRVKTLFSDQWWTFVSKIY